jgi:hypothetical protein
MKQVKNLMPGAGRMHIPFAQRAMFSRHAKLRLNFEE